MTVHIVIFQLIETDAVSLKRFKESLSELKDLSFLIEFSLIEKSNLLKSYIDGDIVLFSKFKNENDLQLYMTDPKHLQIIKNTSENIKDKFILDFNI